MVSDSLRPGIRGAAVILWAGLVLAGFLALERYARRPGETPEPPRRWRADCRAPREPGKPTLICFLHPRCPCSRATVGELARVTAACAGHVTAHVYLWVPADADEGWARGSLADAVAAIDGVTVSVDAGGRDAARWGATTSGETLLFGPDGSLLFSGGITESRGQGGVSAGGAAIIAAVRFGYAGASAPVYGCPFSD